MNPHISAMYANGPRLWIVIVNYRTAALAIDCLRSLSLEIGDVAGSRVAVVDNASADSSVAKLSATILREGWSSWASVIQSDRNGGFSYGNNIGIRAVLAASSTVDYVLLLNPDTIVHRGAIRALVEFMDANPGAGIAGSLLENAVGEIECSAHRAPSPLGELDAGARLGILSRMLSNYVVSPLIRGEAHECDWISGASLMVRRTVLEQIGPMDEGFFLYFEEVDYCCRARKAGWSVWFVPESRVVHLEGAATGIRTARKRRPKYWYDSRRRFFVKHHGIAGLLAADALWAIGRVSFLARRLLRLGGKDGNDPSWFMFDLLWGDLRAVLTGQAHSIRGHNPGITRWQEDLA
jgi:GT2 family glycosyltransferase